MLTNGENHTYHAGAYLGDGLHGGAIASAFEVARLIGSNFVSIAPIPVIGEPVTLGVMKT